MFWVGHSGYLPSVTKTHHTETINSTYSNSTARKIPFLMSSSTPSAHAHWEFPAIESILRSHAQLRSPIPISCELRSWIMRTGILHNPWWDGVWECRLNFVANGGRGAGWAYHLSGNNWCQCTQSTTTVADLSDARMYSVWHFSVIIIIYTNLERPIQLIVSLLSLYQCIATCINIMTLYIHPDRTVQVTCVICWDDSECWWVRVKTSDRDLSWNSFYAFIWMDLDNAS